jgi:hypothetical protein
MTMLAYLDSIANSSGDALSSSPRDSGRIPWHYIMTHLVTCMIRQCNCMTLADFCDSPSDIDCATECRLTEHKISEQQKTERQITKGRITKR